jgi:hypothetical protein
VKEIGYPRLADLHERLRIAKSPSETDLALALEYSKKLLIHLDRATYGKIALDYAKMVRSNDAKRAQMRAARNGPPVINPQRSIEVDAPRNGQLSFMRLCIPFLAASMAGGHISGGAGFDSNF